ncbi:hypothetical protein AKJ59_00410 [candidate division MSBL1 archaeon SCGC-AAA385M02]|uniref:Uncharacterized protein n=1 Tax=candidate division MSBL1 archaeon SCGC-AAA385M02 TaxID=1698287 RepID=A0A133VQU5_9EURY|nr:hypothetical protein AKJ59_00410 [candidate division MSBL1 archaeon SCGC-AAA385M02]
MASNFPTSPPGAKVDFDSSTSVASSHQNGQGEDINAIAAKVGHGTDNNSPANNKVLRGTGSGTSQWKNRESRAAGIKHWVGSPVLAHDTDEYGNSSILLDSGTYYVYVSIVGTSIGYASGSYPLDIEYQGSLLSAGSAGEWDEGGVFGPCVVESGGTYYMFYTGEDSAGDWAIGVATANSPTGTFTKSGSNPILTATKAYENDSVNDPHVIQIGGTWYMYYGGNNPPTTGTRNICIATASSFPTSWTKQDSINPIIDGDVEEPQVVEMDDGYHMFLAGTPTEPQDEVVGHFYSPDGEDWGECLDSPIIKVGGVDSAEWVSTNVTAPAVIVIKNQPYILVKEKGSSTRWQLGAYVPSSEPEPRVICRATFDDSVAAPQAISSAFEKIQIDNTQIDLGNNWDSANYYFVAPYRGYYRTGAVARFDSVTADNQHFVRISASAVLSGTTDIGLGIGHSSSTADLQVNTFGIAHVDKGAQIYLDAKATADCNIEGIGPADTYLEIEFIGGCQ